VLPYESSIIPTRLIGVKILKKIIFYKTLGMLWLIAASFVANFLLNVLLARVLDAKDYGNFFVIKEVVLLGSLLLLQGSNFAILRFVPEYLFQKSSSRIKGYLLHQLKQLVVAVFILVFLAFIVEIFISQGHFVSNNLFLNSSIFYSTIILIPVFALFTYFPEMLRSLNRIYWASALSDFSLPVLFGICLFALYHFNYRIQLLDSLVYYICVLLLLVVLGFVATFCYLPKKLWQEKLQTDHKNWRKTAWQLMAAKLILAILFSSEIILLKVFGHNPKTVGIFAAILTIGSLYWLVFNAISYVISPLISPLAAKQDHLKMQHVLDISTLILLVLIVGLTLSIYIFRVSLLQYFGADFAQGAMPLMIVMIGFAVTVVLGVPWYFIGLSGQQYRLVWPVIIVAISSVIGTSVLSHYYDLLGACIGLALTEIVIGVWLAVIMRRHMKLKVLFFI